MSEPCTTYYLVSAGLPILARTAESARLVKVKRDQSRQAIRPIHRKAGDDGIVSKFFLDDY